MKICSKCKKEFPATREYFYSSKLGKNGLHSRCKKCQIEVTEDWRKHNLEHVATRQRQHRKDNKEWFVAFEKKRNIKRRSTPKGKLDHNMGNALRDCLGKIKGGSHWEDLVGYNKEQLKEHLESKFKEGMTWENYGHGENKWSIDHIIPKYYFKYSTPHDNSFKECWGLNNLQPMWFVENCRKQNKIGE